MARDRAAAFAPGRVNLIGEHTDYNGGLALPFSIAQGVTVRGQRSDEPCISAHAEDLDEHEGSLGTLSTERAAALMWVWRHRYAELGAREDVRYVMIFENRGVEVGVTLHHPHGQVYAYPFLPPVPEKELQADARAGGCAVCELMASELRDGRRVIYDENGVACYVPFAARWAFEVHVVLRAHRTSLLECDAAELRSLGRALVARARLRRPLRPAVSLRDGRAPGARRRGAARAGARGARARRVLSAAAQRRQAQVSGGLRAGGRHVHRRHDSRGVGGDAT